MERIGFDVPKEAKLFDSPSEVDFLLLGVMRFLAGRGHAIDIRKITDNPRHCDYFLRVEQITDELQGDYKRLVMSREFSLLEGCYDEIPSFKALEIFPEDLRPKVYKLALERAQFRAEMRGRCGVIGPVYDEKDLWIIATASGGLEFAELMGVEDINGEDLQTLFAGIYDRGTSK